MDINQTITDIEELEADIRYLSIKKRDLDVCLRMSESMVSSLNEKLGRELYNIRENETGEIEHKLDDGRTIAVRVLPKGNAVNIIDESLLSKDYLREKTTFTPDKMKIKKDMLDGKEIAGAQLSEERYTVVFK